MANEQDRLRQEIAKLHKSVSNKINRTQRQTGAKVGGSEFDPRKPAGAENRMRSVSNMREYAANLKGFMSPANQFIAGQNGAPLRKGYFLNIYKKNEQAVESIRQQRDAAMGDIQTPTGLSVRQQKAAIPEAGGSSVYGPYRKFDRDAGTIKDMNALKKLNADMVKRLKPDYLEGEIGAGRDNIRKVAEHIGDADIMEQVDTLDDYQFDLLWFGTNYADRLFLYYELVKERQDGTKKERKQDRVIETQFAGIGELIEWAKNQTQPDESDENTGLKR